MQSTQAKAVVIRGATIGDGDQIAAIYNHYITDTLVTFEEAVVTGDEMSRRIGEVQADALPWLVAEDNGGVIGYAYASRWKERIGYRFSVETTVYLGAGEGRRGVGSKLYAELFSILKTLRIHAVIGGIALPNDASVALHEKFGMKKVASFSEVGKNFGRWVDVEYWEFLFSDPAD